MKKQLLFCLCFSIFLCGSSFASPYGLFNLNFSPSTTLSSDSASIKNAYGGKAVGLEGISGFQQSNFAFEFGFAYMLYSQYRDYSKGYWYDIVPRTFDGKISLLFTPNITQEGKIINPFYIGPEVGITRYSYSASPYNWVEYGFLYGVKAGARIPIEKFFINVGLSYLKRSGMILPLTNTNISSSNINLNLGLGYYF